MGWPTICVPTARRREVGTYGENTLVSSSLMVCADQLQQSRRVVPVFSMDMFSIIDYCCAVLFCIMITLPSTWYTDHLPVIDFVAHSCSESSTKNDHMW